MIHWTLVSLIRVRHVCSKQCVYHAWKSFYKKSCHVFTCLRAIDRNSFKVKLFALSLCFVGSVEIQSAEIMHLTSNVLQCGCCVGHRRVRVGCCFLFCSLVCFFLCRKGQQLEPSEQYVFNRLEGGRSMLTIHNIRQGDGGTYSCKATNKAGSQERELFLKVFGECWSVTKTQHWLDVSDKHESALVIKSTLFQSKLWLSSAGSFPWRWLGSTCFSDKQHMNDYRVFNERLDFALTSQSLLFYENSSTIYWFNTSRPPELLPQMNYEMMS